MSKAVAVRHSRSSVDFTLVNREELLEKLTVHLSLVGQDDLPASTWRVDGQGLLEALFDVGTPDSFCVRRRQVLVILQQTASDRQPNPTHTNEGTFHGPHACSTHITTHYQRKRSVQMEICHRKKDKELGASRHLNQV